MIRYVIIEMKHRNNKENNNVIEKYTYKDIMYFLYF